MLSAAVTNSATCTIVGKLTEAFINPLLALIFAAGLLVFVWGLVEFLWGLSNEAGKKEEGKQHMLWGLGGMFIMVSAIAIIKLISTMVGGNLPC
ncbi:MAG: seg [Candidatus Adlerbacteria bacterium]|nr:seg [Candidatus Adlerbacteria bacterium]